MCAYSVCLTANKRGSLENFVKLGTHKSQEITRARILLKSDEGRSAQAIHKELYMTTKTEDQAGLAFILHLDRGGFGQRLERCQVLEHFIGIPICFRGIFRPQEAPDRIIPSHQKYSPWQILLYFGHILKKD